MGFLDSGRSDAGTTDAGVDGGVQCSGGQTDCGGVCVTLETGREHCGACDRRCAMGEVCSASSCGIDCSAPAIPCDDEGTPYCADLSNDESNCGACGRRCELGLTCLSGDCALVCVDGTVECSGRCADLTSDAQNCGSCGNSCDRDRGVGVCRARACALTCETGYADCDLDSDNGCEVDIVNSTQHCQRCGQSCEQAQVAESRCTASGCAIEACDAGFADCDGRSDNGCEADLTAPTSCAACGTVCGAERECIAGACIARPVAGTSTLTVCGTGELVLFAFTVDPIDNDVVAILENRTTPMGTCVARGPGGRSFALVSGEGAPLPEWGGLWGGFVRAAGDLVALGNRNRGVAVSFDRGATWVVGYDSPVAPFRATLAVSPTAIVVIGEAADSRAETYFRIDATGARSPIVYPTLPADGNNSIEWDPDTGDFWWILNRAPVGGSVVYRSRDDGRTFVPVAAISTSFLDFGGAPFVMGGYLYGTEYGSRALIRAPTSDLTAAPEDVFGVLGCPGAGPCSSFVSARPIPLPGLGAVARGLVATSTPGTFFVSESSLSFAPSEPGSQPMAGFRNAQAMVYPERRTTSTSPLRFVVVTP